MKKRVFTILMAYAAMLGLVLSGCGASNISLSSGPAQINGVAASGAPVVGTVVLKDASVPPLVKTTATAVNGSFSFNVKGLTPPYVLTVTWTDAAGTNQLYSFADGPGTVNINPFSNAAFAIAADADPATLPADPDPALYKTAASNKATSIDTLRAMLAPLFELYGTAKNPVDDDYEADHTGLDAMFDDIKITVYNSMVIVTNKETGALIFTAPLDNISSGTFDTGNMPGQTGQIDGAALYTTYCSSCHGPLATSSKLGATASQIQSAITSVSAMRYLPKLMSVQIQAIASALSSTSTSTQQPAACTYTYDAWGACQSNNTQTRNLLSSSPAGCTGTPILSQACTYVAPTPGACTYTYDAWGACQSNNTQTRNLLSSSPAGCTGTPILSQTCTYVAACTYTYSAWSACQQNNTQTRNVLTTSPAGCTGTPVVSQSCTYTPPTPTLTLTQVKASCTSCHGLTVNTTVLKSGGYTVTGRTAAAWLSTVNTMVGFGAQLATGTTAQDYANFLAALP